MALSGEMYLAQPGADDVLLRRSLAGIGAALFFGAGVAGLFTVVVNVSTGIRVAGYRPGAVAAISSLGLVGGILLIATRGRVPVWVASGVTTSGIVVLTIAGYYAGPYSPFITVFYIWIGTFAFLFLSRRVAVFHVLLIGVCYGVLLAIQPGNAGVIARWTLVMVGVSVIGAITEWLFGHLRRLAESEHAAREELAQVNRHLEERVQGQVAELERLNRLRRFLSPQVADVVMSAGSEDALAPHRRDIAVFFCDLRGFTRFTSQVEPEEVLDVINAYYDVIGRLLHAHNGTVGDFAGDGIMAYFNDPVPCETPALAAVRMALAVREEMTTLVADWQSRGYDLGYGIGIAYGYATLGIIGFEGRHDYSPLGSVVNLGARLCSRAAPEQILIDQRVHAVVSPACVTNTIGKVTLKGFHDPIKVSEVLGASPGRADGS